MLFQGLVLSPGQPCLPASTQDPPPRTPSDHLGVSMTNITGTSTLDPDFQALGSAVTLGVLAPSTRRQCKRQCGHSWGDGEMRSNMSTSLGDLADRSVIGQQNKQNSYMYSTHAFGVEGQKTKQTENRGSSGAELEAGRPPVLRQVGLLRRAGWQQEARVRGRQPRDISGRPPVACSRPSRASSMSCANGLLSHIP